MSNGRPITPPSAVRDPEDCNRGPGAEAPWRLTFMERLDLDALRSHASQLNNDRPCTVRTDTYARGQESLVDFDGHEYCQSHRIVHNTS